MCVRCAGNRLRREPAGRWRCVSAGGCDALRGVCVVRGRIGPAGGSRRCCRWRLTPVFRPRSSDEPAEAQSGLRLRTRPPSTARLRRRSACGRGRLPGISSARQRKIEFPRESHRPDRGSAGGFGQTGRCQVRFDARARVAATVRKPWISAAAPRGCTTDARQIQRRMWCFRDLRQP